MKLGITILKYNSIICKYDNKHQNNFKIKFLASALVLNKQDQGNMEIAQKIAYVTYESTSSHLSLQWTEENPRTNLRDGSSK